MSGLADGSTDGHSGGRVRFLELASARPDEQALTDGTTSHTRRELVDRATRWGRLLRSLGVEGEAGVAVVLPNRSELVEVVLGTVLGGLRMTPVNPRATVDELAFLVDDSGACALVVDASTRALGADVRARVDRAGGRSIAVVDLDDGAEAALADVSDQPFPLDGPSGAPMAYTSGTTGRPKGVVRTRPAALGDHLASLARVGSSIHLDGGGPHLVTGPMHHAAVFGYALMDLVQGAPVVVMPRFDAERTVDLLAHHEVRHTHLVPTMCVRLLRLPDERRAQVSLPALRTVLHGAAPISPTVKRRMIEWWGPVMVEYWGGSESGVITIATSEEWLAHPGTVGRALAGFEVWAVDGEGGRLPAGEEGLLVARRRDGAQAFEYHGDPEKTARSRVGGGFTLGDVGCVDAEGYVHLSDRASNMIITGGVNVYPAEVEAVLGDHPAVVDVAVFGVPDDEWGEQVRAAVELDRAWAERSVDDVASELSAFASERLARHKVPRGFEVHEHLPRSDTGKLAVRTLRDPHWAGRERRI